MPPALPRPVAPLACVAIALLALTHLHPVMDPDAWWHVVLGDGILAGRGFPAINAFSYAEPTHALRYTDWIGGILLASTHRFLGDAGLSALAAALMGAIYLFSGLRFARDDGDPARLALALLGLGFCLRQFAMPRPDLAGLAIFAAMLWVLGARSVRARWIAVPLLQLLWVNTHRSAVLGPITILVAALWETRPIERRRLAGICALAGAACLAAPYPLFFWSSALGLRSAEAFRGAVTIWKPLDARVLATCFFPLPVFAALAVPGLRGRLRTAGFWLPLAVVLTALSLHTARVLAFAAIAAVPPLVGFARDSAWRRRAIVGTAGGFFAVLMVGSWIAPRAFGAFGYFRPGLGLDAEFGRFPLAAVARTPPGTRIAVPLAQAGYVLQRLGAARPVFVDGRLDIAYSPAFLERYLRALPDPRALADLFVEFGTDLAAQETAPDAWFATPFTGVPDWHPSYVDDAYVLYARGRGPIDADVHWPNPFLAAKNPWKRDPAARARVRAEFERLAAAAPGSAKLRVVLAAVAAAEGDAPREQGYLDEVRRIDPGFADRFE